MTWTTFHVTPSANREGVLEALFDTGSQGVHEDGAALITHFAAETDITRVREAVVAADPLALIVVSQTPEVRWDAWRAAVTAHHVGKLTVAPPWLEDQCDPATTIIIDPAMAFGTGEHATTRGVLRLMQQVIRAGDTVADLGAGSAVLAIAAVRLGAARVAAIELDADAAANAAENIERNGVAEHVRFIEGDAALLLPLVAPVRVIFANIVSSVLLELLPVISAALTPDGAAILSGMLLEEREMMLDRLRLAEWRAADEDVEGEWWSVTIARR